MTPYGRRKEWSGDGGTRYASIKRADKRHARQQAAREMSRWPWDVVHPYEIDWIETEEAPEQK